jgi:hypothetical protein
MSGVTPAAISLLLVHLKKAPFAGFIVPAEASGAAEVIATPLADVA